MPPQRDKVIRWLSHRFPDGLHDELVGGQRDVVRAIEMVCGEVQEGTRHGLRGVREGLTDARSRASAEAVVGIEARMPGVDRHADVEVLGCSSRRSSSHLNIAKPLDHEGHRDRCQRDRRAELGVETAQLPSAYPSSVSPLDDPRFVEPEHSRRIRQQPRSNGIHPRFFPPCPREPCDGDAQEENERYESTHDHDHDVRIVLGDADRASPTARVRETRRSIVRAERWQSRFRGRRGGCLLALVRSDIDRATKERQRDSF